jgi:hypothetical protein
MAAGGVADPVRFGSREVDAFWQAVRAMGDAATRIERACVRLADHGGRRSSVEEVSAAVVAMRRSLAEVIGTVRAAGLPPEDIDGIDEDSERWMTAIHEAAHAIVGAHLGHRVEFAGATTDTTGLTRTGRDATGLEEAVIAVAGEQATQLELGKVGGAATDYARAEAALSGTGWSLEQAEFLAVGILQDHRGELTALARRIYRHGRENNIK